MLNTWDKHLLIELQISLTNQYNLSKLIIPAKHRLSHVPEKFYAIIQDHTFSI